MSYWDFSIVFTLYLIISSFWNWNKQRLPSPYFWIYLIVASAMTFLLWPGIVIKGLDTQTLMNSLAPRKKRGLRAEQ